MLPLYWGKKRPGLRRWALIRMRCEKTNERQKDERERVAEVRKERGVMERREWDQSSVPL